MKPWLAILCVLVAGQVAAADEAESGQPLWEVGAATVLMSLPDYVGSKRQRLYVLPYPYIIYRGERLRMDREGLRGILLEERRLELDFSVGGALPVNSDDNPRRQGMPDLDAALELGPSIKIALLGKPNYELQLDLPLRALFIINRREFVQDGWVAHPRLVLDSYDLGGSGWDLNAKLGVNFMDQAYTNYYYGVAQPYARADRPAYRPGDGYGGFNASLILSKRWGDRLINGFARYDNIAGAVFEDSPLVETRHALRVGINLVWILSAADD